MVTDTAARPQTGWGVLVDGLIAAGTLRSPRVIDAFRATPRSDFVPSEIAGAADEVDLALPIGGGQTVSQPTTVAIMLEAVVPQKGERILDIGTGSGWQAMLLAKLVGPRGSVHTVERVPELAVAAHERLARHGETNLTVYEGDASRGLPAVAPFDVIVAAAEAPAVPPALLDQLAPGGRLVQPIAGMGLRIVRRRQDGTVVTKDLRGFVFVPLVESGEEPRKV